MKKTVRCRPSTEGPARPDGRAWCSSEAPGSVMSPTEHFASSWVFTALRVARPDGTKKTFRAAVGTRHRGGLRLRGGWRGLAGSAMLCASIAAASDTGSLQCSTEKKYECVSGGCRTAEEGFARAERYVFEPRRQRLTACLWSQCFSGAASVSTAADGEARAAARLRGEGPASAESLTLTFTLRPDGGFSAAYSTGGAGLAVAFGRCSPP